MASEYVQACLWHRGTPVSLSESLLAVGRPPATPVDHPLQPMGQDRQDEDIFRFFT